MDFDRASGDLKDLRRRNRSLGLIVGALAVGLLLALVIILNLLGTVRTVVVPPSLSKTFWVTSGKASSEYLEQMGSFVAWLILDVTPSSIDWKKDILLGYVDPAQYGALKTRRPRASASMARRSPMCSATSIPAIAAVPRCLRQLHRPRRPPHRVSHRRWR